jgi:hypothetical protein
MPLPTRCSPLVFDETTPSDVNAILRRDGRLESVPLADIGAVYLRPDISLGSAQHALLAWTEQAPGIIVNWLGAMALNAANPFQLVEISRHGAS